MKRITVLTASDFPYRGAAESFVRQMAFGLFKNNADIEVVRFWGDRYSNINDTPIKCTNYLFREPIKNEFLKFFETLLQIIYIPFFVGYRKLIKSDQVIMMYGLDRAYFVFPLTIFSKLFGIKCYRIITEIYPSYLYASKWWRKPNILFGKWQLQYFDKYLNGVVVLSSMLQDLVLKNKVEKEKVLLIPHFIDLKLYSSIRNKKNNQKVRIGFCGNPSIENGVLDLVEAYLNLRNLYQDQIELIIMGNIKTNIRTEINKYLKGAEQIIFTGLLTKSEVEMELQLCDILVNPRRSSILADSGFPTKIGEYFAARKPVVATKVGDLELYFSNKKELVFAEPNNPKSICQALNFILSNKTISAEIAENGYVWATNNLDYINNSRKLISFINGEVYN